MCPFSIFYCFFLDFGLIGQIKLVHSVELDLWLGFSYTELMHALNNLLFFIWKVFLFLK